MHLPAWQHSWHNGNVIQVAQPLHVFTVHDRNVSSACVCSYMLSICIPSNTPMRAIYIDYFRDYTRVITDLGYSQYKYGTVHKISIIHEPKPL